MFTALAGEVLATGGGFGDDRSGSLAGPMGLLFILLLAVATIFLMRNMNARLRRLPDRFPDGSEGPEPRTGDGDTAPPKPAQRDDST